MGGADFQGHEVAFAGGSLSYWVGGRIGAPWLVISHGGALDHAGFLPLARRLAEDWRILLWDLPGHGASQPMPTPFDTGVCAQALGAVMDAAGAATALQFGFSFGGVVAQVFAKAHPERVDGLALYACFTPHLMQPALDPALAPVIAHQVFGALSWPQILEDFSARCCLTPGRQAEVRRSMQAVGRDGFLAMATALLAASDFDQSFRVNGPVVTIVGAMDSNGEPLMQAMDSYKAAYPDAIEVAISEAGHCAHLDQPEAFESAVVEALRRATAEAG